MRINIDVLMIILLVILVGSLVMLIAYGEVWRINLSMENTHIENFDRQQTQTAFILSCVCAASGGSMLYALSKKFPQEEEKKAVSLPGTMHE